MTTIVAVRKNGMVAIAADTLTTFGNTRLSSAMDSSHDKILRIGESYIGVCGSAAHHLVLANLLGAANHLFNAILFGLLAVLLLALTARKLRQPLLAPCSTDSCGQPDKGTKDGT